jgi:putative ABC transport system permease protein
MKKLAEILLNSFKLALLELRNNTLRTTLSLLGVTFGIFCIIGVLATVNSLEQNVQNDIKSLGSNTIYIDKWDYSGGPDYPWWKYVNRPTPKFAEMKQLKKSSPLIENICFVLSTNGSIEYNNINISAANIYGASDGFTQIQPFEMLSGRYFSLSELEKAAPLVVIGFDNAEQLFGKPEKAVGQILTIKSRKMQIIGVIKKKGKSLMGGWQFDQSAFLSYPYFKLMYDEKRSDPIIMVQGKPNIDVESMRGELKGEMRNMRRLGPKEEDDFTLNSVSDFSKAVNGFFGNVSIGGWFIGILSLIVGAFSIANIMFVTVRERTPIIGLKKAIGAKRRTILAEFLLESAFICILGGAIGLLLVFGMTFVLTAAFQFPVFISFNILSLALGICIMIGVVAGIIPASIAAKMDPVVAIRSK